MARLLAPLAPLALLYNTIPFGPFLVFLGVYSGIVNNQSLPRFVRYNAMQAVLLDVLLIIPQASGCSCSPSVLRCHSGSCLVAT